jgi:hypothetical protein
MPLTVDLLGNAVVGNHLFNPLSHMSIHQFKVSEQDRQQPLSKGFTPRHPLIVAPASMMIGTIELGTWHYPDEPLKELFVSNVHPQGDLGLAAIAAKMPFADQDTNQEALFEFRHGRPSLSGWLFHCQVSRGTCLGVSPSSFTWNIGVTSAAWFPLPRKTSVLSASWT